MEMDLSALWDFNKPAVSEERFRTALATASAEEALILHTQIARTYGLRGDFARAQNILAEIEPRILTTSVETQVYYFLELGRTYSSATHPPDSQTDETRELARAAYMRAFTLAQGANLDSLAIDALHMMPFIDTAPVAQIGWNHKAIALMESSSQSAAKEWEGSLHNNTGYALHLLGQYEDALVEFQLALAAHQREGNPQKIRIAHWMIAWTLRAMGRLSEALELQLRLEKEWDEAGEADAYVFEELEHLYRALGNTEKAEFYAARHKASL